MNERLNKALDKIEEWPDRDLFPEYFE
jgi:hypothetical protein